MFKCKTCEDGYYLDQDTNLCVLKFNNDQFCKETEEFSNRCKKCSSETYLDKFTGICHLSPNKEKNCYSFDDNNMCIACTNNTFPVKILFNEELDRLFTHNKYYPEIIDFLKNQNSPEPSPSSSDSSEAVHPENISTSFLYECESVPAEDIIPDCMAYNKYKQCVKCNSPKESFGSKCIEIFVSDCEEFISPHICSKCKPGFDFTTLTGAGGLEIKSCLEIDIVGCLDKEMEAVTTDDGVVSMKKCNLCSSNKYFDEETRSCATVTDLIENCEFYNNDKTCKFCHSGYLLTNNNTSCNLKLEKYYFGDKHCSIASIEKSPSCSACKTGYFLDINNVCKPCSSQGINSEPRNCSVCSPKSPNKCLMCKVGYNMDIEGNCVLVSDSQA